MYLVYCPCNIFVTDSILFSPSIQKWHGMNALHTSSIKFEVSITFLYERILTGSPWQLKWFDGKHVDLVVTYDNSTILLAYQNDWYRVLHFEEINLLFNSQRFAVLYVKIYLTIRRGNVKLTVHVCKPAKLHSRRRQQWTMMMSSNGNIFRVNGPLCGEFTGDRWIPRTNASDADLWCFLRCKQSWGWRFETTSRPLIPDQSVLVFFF